VAINDVAGERCVMYEIFFVNVWVIIFYVFGLRALKPKNPRKLKKTLKT